MNLCVARASLLVLGLVHGALGCGPPTVVGPDTSDTVVTASAPVAPTSSASASPSSTALAPVDDRGPATTYAPPAPFALALTAPADSELAVFPIEGGAIVLSSHERVVRDAWMISAAGEVKAAPGLLAKLPGVPMQIVGRLPDALWLTHETTLRRLDKDGWVEVSAKGPYRIAPAGSGVFTVRAGTKPQVAVVDGPSGAATKIPALPTRDKKCPFLPGFVVPLDGGAFAVLGEGCAHALQIETWSGDTWTQWKSKSLLFTEDTDAWRESKTSIVIATISQTADGEPMTLEAQLTQTGAAWKEGWVHQVGLPIALPAQPVLAPLNAQKGPTQFNVGPAAPIAGDHAYVVGEIVEADGTKVAAVLATHPITKPARSR